MTSKWDRRFLELARLVASWSQDPSTKTGAVLVAPSKEVISLGFNGFARQMSDDPADYADREVKYSKILHCEINALIFAGRLPPDTILYTWPLLSCDRCAVQMIQAGVTRFVAPLASVEQNQRWGTAFGRTRRYIKEANASCLEIEL